MVDQGIGLALLLPGIACVWGLWCVQCACACPWWMACGVGWWGMLSWRQPAWLVMHCLNESSSVRVLRLTCT